MNIYWKKVKNNKKTFVSCCNLLPKPKGEKNNSPISYYSARQNMMLIIETVGLNPKKFGLPSLRSGGVIVAANNPVKDDYLRDTTYGKVTRQSTASWKTI